MSRFFVTSQNLGFYLLTFNLLLSLVMSFTRIIKDWTLPISMALGVIGYFAFRLPLLQPVKPAVISIIPYFLPMLIFAMLFMTYCKIDPKELKPRPYQLLLVLFQILATSAIAAGILQTSWDSAGYHEMHIFGLTISHSKAFWEAMMACTIAPMAAVGAVVTAKIGGNPTTATTYTVISSMVTAVAVPIIYPLVEPGIGMTFFELFWTILTRVFPTIVFPLLIALFLRAFVPTWHEYFVRTAKDKSFYLWAICTVVNVAQIMKIIMTGPASGIMEIAIVIAAGVLCGIQFAIGKSVGHVFGDKISAGQSLGQKNTVLSIWIAMSFLAPESALAPGAYLLWQNMINSWQIWKHGRA